jgi:hypothetical protein
MATAAASAAASAAAAAAAAAEMMARTRKNNNAGGRSVISDGVLSSSGAIITPLLPTTTSFVHHKKRSLKGDDEEDKDDQKQDDSSKNNGYIPAFEGYLTIGFSVYVPGSNTNNELGSTTSDVDDSLESLIMLFLCSKEVELVISTDPSLPLTPVCPFAEIDSQNTHTTNYYGDKIIVWNLPKTTTRTVAFDDSTTASDAETDTSTTNSKSKDSASSDEDQEYYTQWEFTYPVYQWGSNDNTNAIANNEILQDTFNTQVIDTGTLDSLLPWPNALSSSYGNEPYTFWDQTRPPIPLIYNTDIPSDVSIALMYVGGGMIVINTLFALIMNGVLRYCRTRHRLRRKKHQAEMEQRRGHHGGGGMTMEEGNMRKRTKTEYLDTEEGVSAILMESKQYAITKSMRDSMNSTSSSGRRSSSTSTLRVGNTAANTKITSSPTTIAKENNLVARAKHHQQEWHSYGQNNNLLGGGSDEDGEDEDLIANC